MYTKKVTISDVGRSKDCHFPGNPLTKPSIPFTLFLPRSTVYQKTTTRRVRPHISCWAPGRWHRWPLLTPGGETRALPEARLAATSSHWESPYHLLSHVTCPSNVPRFPAPPRLQFIKRAYLGREYASGGNLGHGFLRVHTPPCAQTRGHGGRRAVEKELNHRPQCFHLLGTQSHPFSCVC